jgi:MFS family permease
MLTLNIARALTGIGGGGLITMSTVILSDHIPFHKRGTYQAINNLTMGIGATLGASLGGVIADNFGWRWAFFLQLPFASFGILVGYFFINAPRPSIHENRLRQVDYLGSGLLVIGLSIQLMGQTLGGNELPWGSPIVVGCLVISGVILAIFLYVEGWIAAHPVLPLSILTEAASITNNLFTAAACTSVISSIILR